MFEEPRRLHPASILIVFLEQVKSLVTVVVFILIARVMGGGSRSGFGDLIFVGFGVLAILPAIFHYLTVRFFISPDSFTMTSGLLFRQKRVIPLERIQNVSLKRNVVQRLLGVTTLEIETASGAGAEAKLAVVGEKDALAISQALQRKGEGSDATLEPEKPPLYRATLGQLILAGATQNRAGVIIAFFAGILNYAQEFVDWERLPSILAPWLPSAQNAMGAAFIVLILLLLAGWFVSIITETVANFGFELRRENGLLRLKHGLFTQVRAALPVRRIQSLRVVSPVIQRMLGLSNVFAESAASPAEHSAGGARRLAPIIENANLQGLVSVVFPELTLATVEYRQVSPIAKRRSFVRNLILGLVLLGIAEYFLGVWTFTAIPVVAAAAWYAAAKRYQILGYSRHDGFLLTRDGVWKRTVTALPENRVQWVGITQGPLQRRLGICSVQVVSASAGGSGVLNIPDLPDRVGRELLDDLSAIAATTRGAL